MDFLDVRRASSGCVRHDKRGGISISLRTPAVNEFPLWMGPRDGFKNENDLRWSIIPLKELTFALIFVLVLVLTFVLAGEFVGWLVTRLSAKRPEQRSWRR